MKGFLPVAFLAAGCLLLACRRSDRKVVAVIPKANSHLFWVSVQAGAMAAGEEFGLQVLWNGAASETDFSRQIQIVDSMVARRVDGLAVAAAERKALVGPIDRAVEAGIPVTIFDSGLDSTNYMSFVATDNYAAGQMAARALARLVGGRGKVAVVMHVPGSASTMDRERGFDDCLARDFPRLRVVARQYGQSDRAKAMAAAENILTAHPDLDGLFASTEPSSVGAAQALKARGLSGKVKLVAFDSSEGMIEDLKGGTISAMVVQDPYRMGREAVKTLADRLKGRQPPKRIDLAAVLVDLANLDQPDIRSVLFPDVKRFLGR